MSRSDDIIVTLLPRIADELEKLNSNITQMNKKLDKVLTEKK